MERLMQFLYDANEAVSSFVWGPPMLVFFLSVGVMFTVRTRFFPVTQWKEWWSETFFSCFASKGKTKESSRGISQWQAVATALASTSGTGNIAGVATALTAGGPGAVFWMWVSAFFGMMTHYAEVVLGVKYREKDEEGKWTGSPMMYMERGLRCRWMAVLFAFFCMIATLGIGNMSQSNSMADALSSSFGISKLQVGFAASVIVGLVILGGIERIASVSETVVPLMAGLYLLGALGVIITHLDALPGALGTIFKEAFRVRSAAGGVLGYGISAAMGKGISRGVFSNEAGLGSTVMVYAASDADEPVTQGMWGIFEVFADTMVVCTITALTILCSGVYSQEVYLTAMEKDRLAGGSQFFDALPNGVALTSQAFATTFGRWGDYFVTISIVLFAMATLMGWSYFGERGWEYLFGPNHIAVYKIIYAAFIMVGAVIKLRFVWSISDTFNGLMAIPNLIAITLLSKEVLETTKTYFRKT